MKTKTPKTKTEEKQGPPTKTKTPYESEDLPYGNEDPAPFPPKK